MKKEMSFLSFSMTNIFSTCNKCRLRVTKSTFEFMCMEHHLIKTIKYYLNPFAILQNEFMANELYSLNGNKNKWIAIEIRIRVLEYTRMSERMGLSLRSNVLPQSKWCGVCMCVVVCIVYSTYKISILPKYR